MKAQELFEIGVLGVVDQGEFSSDGNGRCFYCLQKSDGTCLKCVVGQMIPDAIYRNEIDKNYYNSGTSVRTISRRFPEIVEHIFPSDMGRGVALDFLESLQYSHDNSVSMSRFLEKSIEIGQKFNLDVTKLQNRLNEFNGE